MNNIISKDIPKFRGSIIRPSSTSRVSMKIDGNLNTSHVNPGAGSKIAVSHAAEGISGKNSFDDVLRSRTNGQSGVSAGKEKWSEYTIKSGDTIWDLAVNKYHVNIEDVIRDNNIDDPRKIQPGDKIRIRIPSYPSQQTVTASWYGRDYHGKAMANGQSYDMYASTIAHKDLPLGTRVELENKETGVKVTAVVTDRGPFIAGRDVDLSYGLARKLSIDKKGVGSLVMRVIG